MYVCVLAVKLAIFWMSQCATQRSLRVAKIAMEVWIGYADPPQWLLKAHNLVDGATEIDRKKTFRIYYCTRFSCSPPVGILVSAVDDEMRFEHTRNYVISPVCTIEHTRN